MKIFEDLYFTSLNKAGEELCGDQIRVLRTEDKTRVVLSDGLGSGVKANILASLTVEIMINMLREEASLADVVETISRTLPVCKQRNLAYATFTVIEIDHRDLSFRACNFDNPPLFFFRNGKYRPLNYTTETILNRKIQIAQGTLQEGDFLAAISDGIAFAGLGNTYNLGWGMENIAEFIEKIFQYHPSSAKTMVQMTSAHTRELYADRPGDDASMLGILLRPSREALVFTGPPLDEAEDRVLAERILNFPGSRIVCGGTTGNIVAAFSQYKIETDISTLQEDLPPIGRLPGIDLLTEGILTLNKASEWIEGYGNNPSAIPAGINGALMLAKALLDADEITFLLGQKTNPFYQNPLLPVSISIRKNLVEKIAKQLLQLNKRILIEYH